MDKDDINYHQFADDIVKVHGALLQVKESFNLAVGALKDMQTINKYIQEACSFQTLPFDTGDEDKRIASIDLSDESFTINVTRILRDKSGLERCAEIQKIMVSLIGELNSFKEKKDKLDNIIKLIPRDTDDDKIAYNAQVAARSRVVKAISNRTGKLNFIVKKYLKQRKANLLRQLGIDEMLFNLIRKSDLNINKEFFNKNDISKLFESFAINDSKISKEHK